MEEQLLKQLKLLDNEIEQTVQELPEDQEQTQVFDSKTRSHASERSDAQQSNECDQDIIVKVS